MAETKIKIKRATNADIDGILEIEFERYETLYTEFPDKRKTIRGTFIKRLKNAPEWFFVALVENKVVGFVSAMPTNKSHKDFKSWETTTNKGTLEGVVDADGKNVYVVNLDVGRHWTKKGVQYLLMARLGKQIVSSGKDIIYFESRIPLFRDWVSKNVTEKEWSKKSQSERLEIVMLYSKLRNPGNGQLYDRLLAFYEKSGFVLDRVVAEAFVDGESLNYGVVCYAKNPFPRSIRASILNPLYGVMAGIAFKYPKVLAKIL